MSLSPQAQAVLLLTAHLSQAEKGQARPLSAAEWSRLARWLKDRDRSPEDLLGGDPDEVLRGWKDPRIPSERLRHLLGRSLALALTLERWQRAGIWVLIRSDPDYPGRLKERLRTEAPPLFFGCGNRTLLQRGGIAVVGSRRASEESLARAARFGAEAARQALTLISGGAKGVDEAAMQGALSNEGTAVGALADSLLRNATASRYRERLASGDLALVSMANPEAGFDVGNAMARNKIIYCLSDATIVVTSSRESGGTWHGAVENLRHGWVPTWVLPDPDPGSGNSALIELGAHRLPDSSGSLAELLVPPAPPQATRSVPRAKAQGGQSRPLLDRSGPTFYELFLSCLKQLTREAPATMSALQGELELEAKQLERWLSRAVKEGRARKLSRPARYQWQMPAPRQASMFPET